MKLFAAILATESNTFVPIPTGREDFGFKNIQRPKWPLDENPFELM